MGGFFIFTGGNFCVSLRLDRTWVGLPILGHLRRKEDTVSPLGLLDLASQKSRDGLPKHVVRRSDLVPIPL